MNTYEVFLENPVSVNHAYFSKVITKNGRSFPLMIEKSGTKEFKEYAAWKFKEATVPQFRGDKKIIIEAWGIWPDKRKRDLGNFEKCAVDAFVDGGHVPDDKIVLWREQDYWVEPGVFGLKLKIYESELIS